ncbi:MAG TPA: MarR family transcriptional regulator [Gaiellaceae bacterium]|nr:MarR family transcriptional regulator [Gaiellaceae bacterium]
MITKEQELAQLRQSLRRVLRGLWARRRPTAELLALVDGEPPLGRRHVALLAHIGSEGEQTVSEAAAALGLSLPAVSKLTRELEDHRLIERSEDPADRRRTVIRLHEATAQAVRRWLEQRSKPLEQTLAALDANERAAFLKGLNALGDALRDEAGPCSPRRGRTRRR